MMDNIEVGIYVGVAVLIVLFLVRKTVSPTFTL